ncbi:MAG: DUF2608 domain-containing protein [Candidatus Jidaibacter sp.]|nr:DUF2608 domain-containing protein [Candidatus Jidaibacter sp.]
MRKIYTFLLFALLTGCTANNQTNTIKSIQSYDQVDFENITDPATVVLFDVDETLIQPEDTYLINEHSERGLRFRQSLIQKHPKIMKMHDIGGIILDQAARPLIEKEVINKIRTLKKNNINVFAITAMNTGEYSNIGRMERWRYEHLKKLGFEGTYQNYDFYLQGFKRKPVFYKSIIATDLEDKGEVLMATLDKINLRPQKIIMFDDTLEFLYSVEKECKKRGIIFFGYHYNGAKKKDWDENVISFQAEYLIKHKKWLSDAEVKEKMRKNAL